MAKGFWSRRLAVRAPQVEAQQRYTQPLSWLNVQEMYSLINGVQYYTPWKASSGSRLMTSCGPVASVIDRRASVMGEARPAWQRFEGGRPTELFSSRELQILREPWRGATWRDLVQVCEADAAAAGNSYWIREGNELVRLEPDWVTIVDAEVTRNGVEVGCRLLGYAVERPGHSAAVFEPGEVAHYAPGGRNGSPFRGESWLAAVASDATSDIELTSYKGNYLRNGAMPSIAVTYEPTLDMAQLEAFVPQFAEKFTGAMNAGKVMHFLGGRDVKTVGATLDQLAYKAVQGAGETRIAAAAGVPASVAGFSEGLAGSSLNAGNYTATRRLFGDAKIRPLLGSLCEAFQTIVEVPAGARLWYDDSQVSFFQEDVTDEAQIRQMNAATIKSLLDAGFTPETVVPAVQTGDFSKLKHSGLYSVQLQPPGASNPTPDGTTPPTQGGTDDQPQD